MTFRVTVTQAQLDGHVWAASSWTGSLLMASPYVSSGGYFCKAFHLTTSLSGNASGN
jgi:hypothetical protein